MTKAKYCETYGVSTSTLKRRKIKNELTVDESDKVYRLMELYQAASVMFNHDTEATHLWIHEENDFFLGQTPVEMTRTGICFNMLLTFIKQKRHGVIV